MWAHAKFPHPKCALDARIEIVLEKEFGLLLLAFMLTCGLRMVNRRWLQAAALAMVLSACTGCQGLHGLKSAFHRQADMDQQIARANQLRASGLDSLENGKLDQAKSIFSRAIELNPNDHRVRQHLAETLASQGQQQQAIAEMMRAVNGSQDPQLNVQLGRMLLVDGQWLPAVRQAELALEADPKLAEAWLLRGDTHFAKGNWKSALSDYHRAIGYQPEIDGVHLKVAETYQQLNQPLRALSSVEHYLARYPEGEQPQPALIQKAKALMGINQAGEAIALLALASQRDDALAETYVRLGQAQLMEGQVSAARTTWNLARQRYPQESTLSQLVEQLQTADQRVAVVGQ